MNSFATTRTNSLCSIGFFGPYPSRVMADSGTVAWFEPGTTKIDAVTFENVCYAESVLIRH
jgi:hypothetical protein